MRILVGIPALYGYDHTKAAIESVLNQKNADLLLIDNGGDEGIKRIVTEYENNSRVYILRNPKNIFVNPAWNQIINCFLHSEFDYYDQLIIMNSDLAMNKGWSEVVEKRFGNKETLIPVIATDLKHFNTHVDPSYLDALTVYEGTAGVFISLTRRQAKMVYPIPEDIKVWFGDNWIFGILRAMDNHTVIPTNLIAIHGNSQTVSKLPGISELIEEDKIAWANHVEPMMQNRINELRSDNSRN